MAKAARIVGTPLKGRVVIVDDVISDGAAKREAIDLIRRAGATPAAILLALDRQERGQGDRSAVQEIQATLGVNCVSILTLGELLDALENPPDGRARVSAQQLTALQGLSHTIWCRRDTCGAGSDREMMRAKPMSETAATMPRPVPAAMFGFALLCACAWGAACWADRRRPPTNGWTIRASCTTGTAFRRSTRRRKAPSSIRKA